MIGVAVNSEQTVRDALRDGVPLDQLHERKCSGCGTDLIVNEKHLRNAGGVFAQLGLPQPTRFFCLPCAKEAEKQGRR
jgi:hypothetical protein